MTRDVAEKRPFSSYKFRKKRERERESEIRGLIYTKSSGSQPPGASSGHVPRCCRLRSPVTPRHDQSDSSPGSSLARLAFLSFFFLQSAALSRRSRVPQTRTDSRCHMIDRIDPIDSRRRRTRRYSTLHSALCLLPDDDQPRRLRAIWDEGRTLLYEGRCGWVNTENQSSVYMYSMWCVNC